MARLGRLDQRGAAGRLARGLVTVAALVTLVTLAACDDLAHHGPATCDRTEAGNPPIRYAEGTVEDGVYMSAPWDGEHLYFPGGMHYAFPHGLGTTPRWFQAYVSLERFADPERRLAIAAGNQAELVRADDETLVIANKTCAEFWLLVVAGGGAEPPPAGPLEMEHPPSAR